MLRPDAGIKDPDDDVRAIVGFGPEASLVAEAEELRRARGVEVAATVFEDSEDGRVGAYGGYLLGREKGGEAVKNGVVYVEDGVLLGELGGVPVVVGGKHRWLGVRIHTEDESFGGLIGANRGKENEEEKDGER